MRIRATVIEHQQFARSSGPRIAEVRVDATFPVAVPQRSGARCNRQLLRHEEVVRDNVCREMREISKRKRAKRGVIRLIVNLESDAP